MGLGRRFKEEAWAHARAKTYLCWAEMKRGLKYETRPGVMPVLFPVGSRWQRRAVKKFAFDPQEFKQGIV